MNNREVIALSRTTEALLIPAGVPITLEEGTLVVITQALGGSFTVNVHGNLARIDAKDADALDKTPDDLDSVSEEVLQGTLEEQVWSQLRTCYDPEIPVNIVDLGLIYECHISDKTAEGLSNIRIVMTLTAPGCGMGPFIVEEAKQKILMLPSVNEVEVEMVFDPPWDKSMMSDEAKLQLGLF